ncbi:MAG: hypothetical protein JXQ65_14775 [Candidatus Marinimicrobia bacterium]|nr:hypothetical protein [Candidatus Neomarinimicrobiota bacterium]
MKKFFFVTLLIGVTMGPCYQYYCDHFSTKEYGKHEVFSQNVIVEKVEGKTFYRKTNSKWNSPIYINLKPEMNPISFVTEVYYHLPVEYTTCKTGFVGRLSKDNATIWQEEFSVSAVRKNLDSQNGTDISINHSGNLTGYSNLKTFNIAEPGKYKLLMLENVHSDLAISKINLIIRGNLKTANNKVVLAGFVVIGASLLFLFIGFVAPRRRY